MGSELVVGRVGAALRPYVAWSCGYRDAGTAPGTHRGLPSPWLTLIVTLDDPLVISEHPDPRQRPSRHRTLVGGLHTRPALITHEGRQSGLQLAVSPLAARALLGVPAGELAAADLEGGEVLGRVAQELHERVRAGSTWAQRFAALAALPVREVAGPAPEVRQAWRRLHETGGRIAVRDLAAEVGWSTRHLSAQLVRETGLSTKAAARVVRFDRVRRALGAGSDLGALAVEHGFYDQSHLTNEFTALAGCSPARWLRQELRSGQDDTLVGAGASSA